MKVFYHNHVLRNSTPREWRRQNSPIRNRKGDNKMNKRDFRKITEMLEENYNKKNKAKRNKNKKG